jgi:hypothetical protein
MNADGSSPHPITYAVPNEYTANVALYTPGGKTARKLVADGAPGAVALKGAAAAVIVRLAATDTKRIEIFDLRSGASRGLVPVPHAADATLLAAGRWLVYSAARTIYLVDPVAKTTRVLARAASSPIGLLVAGRRVAWGENLGAHGHVRAVLVPP